MLFIVYLIPLILHFIVIVSTAAHGRNKRAGFLGSPEDEFCESNKVQFGNTCNDRFADSGQNDFCSTYGVRCRGWRKVQARPVAQSTSVVQSNQRPISQNNNFQSNPRPISQNNPLPPSNARRNGRPFGSQTTGTGSTAYCRTYGSDYYTLCLRGSVPDFGSNFCNGFSQACPGVPPPGTLVGKPVNPPPPSLVNPNPIGQPLVSNAIQPQTPVNPNFVPPSQINPNAFPPQIPTNPNVVSPQFPTNPNVPLSSLPSNPNLPSGGLSSLPSNPSFPTNSFPSQPLSPTGSFPSSGVGPSGLPQTPNIGGPTPGGIGLGQQVNAPFFGGQSGANISPLSGVGTGTNLNAAGVGVGQSQGVNFGGLPFLGQVGQAVPGLGGIGAGSGVGAGRKRRRRNAHVLL